MRRQYQEDNFWINFKFEVTYDELWTRLGEAFSKCQHLAGSPLTPTVAGELARIYLTKGALGSTAIEGNTLSEDEARDIIDGQLSLPSSQQYLEQELKNVAEAIMDIDHSARNATEFVVSPEWIREQNRKVLDSLEHDEHVVPGEYTEKRLVVGSYRSVPPEDVSYLMDRLCEWLNDQWLRAMRNPELPPELRFANAFFAATLGHLYIAWIHPFGDGNGRTARLLECAILAHSGLVPWVSSNVLSDFYNRTRTRYYDRLEAASKANDVLGFVRYSAEGFVDMLREQITKVRQQWRRVSWANYVHETMAHEPAGAAKDRRRRLVLSMDEAEPITKKEMRILTPGLAADYAQRDMKTTSRDVGRLLELNLLRLTEDKHYVPNTAVIDSFQPIATKWAPS